MLHPKEKICLALIFLISLWVASNIGWGKDRWKGILESDAKGYYAYLPAVFIYQDLQFDFFEKIEKEKYADPHFFYDYRVPINNKNINKYWMGTATCELPFFLLAHGITIATGQDADGYSKVYPICINLAGIFYALVGIIFSMKLLTIYNIAIHNRILVALIIFFGTNLFYYAVVEPGMSHVYSFCMITALLYLAHEFFDKPNNKKLLLLLLCLSLIFLIRPQNVLVALFIPFAARNKNTLIKALKWIQENFKPFLFSFSACILLASAQLIYYKYSCGVFFVDSYPGEYFQFNSPHLIDIFFSYKKGLFLYTPVYLVSLLGLYYVYRSSKYQFIFISAFLFILSYILSSWHNWWYGGSFSSRVFVDYLFLFILCLSFLLQYSAKKIKISATIICYGLLLLCQFQIYQYRYNILHWEGMTKETYWNNFLRFRK